MPHWIRAETHYPSLEVARRAVDRWKEAFPPEGYSSRAEYHDDAEGGVLVKFKRWSTAD